MLVCGEQALLQWWFGNHIDLFPLLVWLHRRYVIFTLIRRKFRILAIASSFRCVRAHRNREKVKFVAARILILRQICLHRDLEELVPIVIQHHSRFMFVFFILFGTFYLNITLIVSIRLHRWTWNGLYIFGRFEPAIIWRAATPFLHV